MNALVMLVLGAGFGAGVLLVIQSLRPSTVPMRDIFDAVEQPGVGFNDDATHPVGGQPLRRMLIRAGTASLDLGDQHPLRRDLAVTGSSIEDHAIVKAGAPALAETPRARCQRRWRLSIMASMMMKLQKASKLKPLYIWFAQYLLLYSD